MNYNYKELKNQNISFSYDYEELIIELKEELAISTLSLDGTIQVLRKNRGIYDPIIDWFYDAATMEQLIPDMNEELIKSYKKDKPFLQTMKVSEVLKEMEEMNQIM